MPPNTYLQDYKEALLDLLWSLWTELGVSGWKRNHPHWMLDPEHLLVFTTSMASLDPRLSEECIDWCVRSGDQLSVDRLKNILKEAGPEGLTRFGRLAATVRKHKGPKLPHPTTAIRAFTPSRKSERPELTRPSSFILRSRKLFGVGVKAELITNFLLSPERWFTINEIVDEGIGFARISVSSALDDLVEAQVVEVDRSQRDGHFRLHPCPLLLEALQLGLPLRPRWKELFSLLELGLGFLSTKLKKNDVELLEIAEIEERIHELTHALELQSGPENGSSLFKAAVAGALGYALAGGPGALGGLIAADSTTAKSKRRALEIWFVDLAKQLAKGDIPTEAGPWQLNRDAFATYLLLLHWTRNQGAQSPGQSLGSSDLFLRRLALEMPTTREHIIRLLPKGEQLNEELVKLYLAEVGEQKA